MTTKLLDEKKNPNKKVKTLNDQFSVFVFDDTLVKKFKKAKDFTFL